MGKRRRSSRRVGNEPDSPKGGPPSPCKEARPFRVPLMASAGAMLAVGLLTASFAPTDWWPLAYVALAPWVMAVSTARRQRWPVALAWASGLAFWAVNLYWLWWITLVGYAAGVIYLSGYWLVAAVAIRAARRRNWPMWAVLPIVWVALEYARTYVIGGFPWFCLAHSQYARTPLIQIADVTGQYGVSFFVAMVNGAVVDVLLAVWRPDAVGGRARLRAVSGVVVASLITAAMLGYGYWRMAQKTTRPGPVIGLVQQAFPINLHGRTATAEKILTDHLASSQRFVGTDCDLVIWPETMLPAGLNAEMLELDVAGLGSADLRSLARRLFGPAIDRVPDQRLRHHVAAVISQLRGQADRVAALSQSLGCPILAGGATIHRNDGPPIDDADRWLNRNSLLLFDGGPPTTTSYSKVHLVPFGEYVPFKHSWTGLHRLLRKFVPETMEQLAPGRSLEPVTIAGPGGQWRLATPICYEGTFPRVCRAIAIADGRKRADILANLSNDGWFAYMKWGRGSYQGSWEHAQHLVHYCFRAVENRLPVVRAVNTGISASIDSCGRIRAEVDLRLDDYTARTMVPGTLLLKDLADETAGTRPGQAPQVLVDSRVTVYSLVGDAFAMSVSAVAVVLSIWMLWKRPGRAGQADVAK